MKKEKSYKKLIETLAGVVGDVHGAYSAAKIRKIGKAEAENEKLKIIARAESKKDAEAIITRAKTRQELQLYQKQVNVENIAAKTQEELKGKDVSAQPVDKDWTMRFLDVAENISRENMQDILAKILAGEIQKPQTFSLQTLEIVKRMGKDDLEIFLRFIAISNSDGILRLGEHDNFLFENQRYGVTYSDFLHLASLGLFSESLQLTKTYAPTCAVPEKPIFHFLVGDELFLVGINVPKMKFRAFSFSRTGMQLRPLLLDSASNDKAHAFKQDFERELVSKGCKVKRFPKGTGNEPLSANYDDW